MASKHSLFESGKPWEDPAERHKLLKECEQHVRLCVTMFKYQMQHGRYFVHDHPYTTSSWEMQEVWKLMSEAGVYFVEINQRETGAVLPSRGDDGKEEPIRSHSGFLIQLTRDSQKLGRDQIPEQGRR